MGVGMADLLIRNRHYRFGRQQLLSTQRLLDEIRLVFSTWTFVKNQAQFMALGETGEFIYHWRRKTVGASISQ